MISFQLNSPFKDPESNWGLLLQNMDLGVHNSASLVSNVLTALTSTSLKVNEELWMGLSPFNIQQLVSKTKIGNYRNVLISGPGLEKKTEWSI